VFEPCTLQVGDRNFYTFRENDTVVTKEQWRRVQRDSVLAGSTLTNGPACTLQQNSPKENRKKGKSVSELLLRCSKRFAIFGKFVYYLAKLSIAKII